MGSYYFFITIIRFLKSLFRAIIYYNVSLRLNQQRESVYYFLTLIGSKFLNSTNLCPNTFKTLIYNRSAVKLLNWRFIVSLLGLGNKLNFVEFFRLIVCNQLTLKNWLNWQEVLSYTFSSYWPFWLIWINELLDPCTEIPFMYYW